MECNNAIMDLESIEKLIEMRENKLYLQQHTGKIWQGKNQYWYTYVGEGYDRKLIKRKDRDSLDTAIVKWYKENIENPTVNDIFSRWLEAKLEYREITRPTYDRYIVDFNKYFEGFRKLRIRSITEDDLDIFIRATIRDYNLSVKQYANIRTVIIGIFKYAKRHHYTQISISTFMHDLDISKRTFRPVQQKNLDTAVFHTDELEKLMDYLYANQTIENLGLIFCFQTGLRRSELAAVKFSDIKDGILHVQRQEIRYKSGEKGHMIHEVVEYTKTEAGNRFIYLPDNSNAIIFTIQWLNRDCEWLMAKEGKRIQACSFDHVIKNACKAAGIPERSMHKIRRTYGTTLIDNNVEDSLIMSQMGHTNISTTHKYYYFANKDEKHKRDQINDTITF